MLLEVSLWVISFVAGVLAVTEVGTISVYGWYLSNKVISKFVYEVDSAGSTRSDMLKCSKGSLSIKRVRSPISRWYVDGVGTIPVWSKYSKILTQKQIEILTGGSRS